MLPTIESKVRICEKDDSAFPICRDRLKGILISMVLFLFAAVTTFAQSNVTTQHNDVARTGANPNETILAPTNVNTNTFGKLFSYPVDGWVYAQPLYMPDVTMGAGTAQPGTVHNVVFVATEHDSVFAFDADNNIGANANPLWQVSLLGSGETTVSSSEVSTTNIIPEIGVTSTPVIDPTTNTIYVLAKSTVADTTFVQRLHALDITTGQEKFGGPMALSASVPGTGNGSSGGTLNWDPLWENNRTGLLLLNGIVYIGFGSHGDNGPWHGWILAYNASTLTQTGAWCSTPNAAGAGIWIGGTGLAADVPSGKPYGRIFTPTGNGTFDATAPNYTNAMDYGDSIIKLDLNNGAPTMNANGMVVGDDFTPYDQAAMDTGDEDVASGGVVLIPPDSAVQVGKSGRVYILNRENLGGYSPNNTTDPEQAASVGGLWGAPAYWNGNVYIWGTNDNLKAFSYANGVLSSTPTSTSNESAGFFSPSPAVSANGTTNGIVWSVLTDNYSSQGTAVLYAHDARNVANLLYSSATNATRDNPGNSVKFIVPTVVNGKVYVGSEAELSVFGLLGETTQAATPLITPASESFSASVQVTISDSTSGASIYYTTDGSQPTVASTQYSGPFTLTSTSTVNAIAVDLGLAQSSVASATYSNTSQAATPTFSPAAGTYTTAQTVTISDATSGATIYYTTDGTTPTPSSTQYTGPLTVGAAGLAPRFVSGAVKSQNNGSLVLTLNVGNPVAGNLIGAAVTWGSPGPAGSPAMTVTDNCASGGSSDTYLLLNSVLVGGGSNIAQYWTTVGASTSNCTITFTSGSSSNDGSLSAAAGIVSGANTVEQSTLQIQTNPGTGTNAITSGSTAATSHADLVMGWTMNPEYNGQAAPSAGSGFTLQASAPNAVSLESLVQGSAGTTAGTFTSATGTSVWMTGAIAFANTLSSSDEQTTIKAIAVASGAGASAVGTAVYTITASTATPTFSPAAGTYTTAQTVTISDATSGATIYYTTNGTTPTTASTQYTGALTVSASETVEAIAVASGEAASALGTAVYTITSGGAPVINLGAGFTAGAMTLNGNAALNGTRLRLTNGGTNEAASAWYSSPVNIQQFTTNFSFQITGGTKPTADGFAFVIQGGLSSALGPGGGGLGYGPPGETAGIGKSVAVKFDLYSNDGEGVDSTGLYTDGASPTTPAVNMTSSGVNLHTTDVFNVQISYDGTNLTMTITDASTNATFTQAWPVNIPTTVGGNTALVGFTGGSGGLTAIQEIIDWTMASNVAAAAATPTFSPAAGTYTTAQTVTISDATSGATIYYTTNGMTPTTASTQYAGALTVSASETVEAIAVASGEAASAVGTAVYTITASTATPTFSPAAGTYTTAQTVTISDATSGATIYYTTNGTTPTTASTQYTGALTVSASETIEAIAVASGEAASAVSRAVYTITASTATPTFSPAAGTYTTAQTVTISDATSGATIYYTTDGTTPTPSSTQYTGPLTVGAAGLGPGFVSGAVKSQNNGSLVLTLNVGNPVAGNLIGAAVTWGSPGPAGSPAMTVTDNCASGGSSDTYLLLNSVLVGGGSNIAQYWTTVGASTSNCTITFTSGSSSNDGSLSAAAGIVSGANTVEQSTLQIQTNPGTGTNAITSGSTAATSHADLVMGWTMNPEYNGQAAPSAGSGFTLQASAPNAVSLESLVQGSAGTTAGTFTSATGTSVWMTGAIAFANTLSSSDEQTTIKAIAVASGAGASAVGTAVYTITASTATPTFSPAAGTYTTAQTVTISDATSGATIYYTTNGTTPTTASTQYTGALTVSASETVEAIAVASGEAASALGTAVYTITSGGAPVINLGAGFTAGAMTLNGNAALNGTRLRLTNGGTNEAASAWYSSPVNIQQFTTNFSFQITGGTKPTADGFAFVIQGGLSSALGPGGGGLGYGPPGETAGIGKSVAVKFDLYSNDGEGVDSTGLYTDGASPTTPAVNMTSSGVNLHTTDVFNVQISYDGTNLTMTITDASTNATFTQAWPVNIPTTVGGNTALVGFTGGSGGLTAIQEIIDWTMAE